MTILGRCCNCPSPTDPPEYENDCTASIYRNSVITASPGSATSTIVTEPGTEWYQWFEEAFPTTWRWRSDISALHEPTTGDPTPKTIIVAPLRFTANYPTSDGGEWPLVANEGENFHWDITDAAFQAGQNRSMYSVDGAFATNSHIWPGQKISEGTVPLEDYPTAKQRSISFNSIRSNYYYNPGGFGSPYTWMARIRYVSLNDESPVDLIPTEYVHDFANGPQCGFIGTGGPYGYNPYDYGLWQYDIPISFSGGSMTWDIWIELHGTVGSAALPYLRATNQRSSTLPSGNPSGVFGASVGYELQVLKNWRNETPANEGDDWQFTFTGGDAPTDGTETISISDMTDRERTSCYVIGRFTWGGIWANTTFQLSFYWDREVPVIALNSLTSDEEFGPYNTAIEGYVPASSNDVELISSWTLNSVNSYYNSNVDHFSVQTPRGVWNGGTAQFTFALDGKSKAGSFADAFNTGEWPTSVTVTKVARTTQ